MTLTISEVEKAWEEWGANCGPGALAAALDLSLDEVRRHLVGFDDKRYTNPSMMKTALRSLEIKFQWSDRRDRPYLAPLNGLARVQWDGPWMKPGVPPAASYRHTHWIASRNNGTEIFDINCMSAGGWVPFSTWQRSVVPWILKACEPKATGEWWFTHLVEIRK